MIRMAVLLLVLMLADAAQALTLHGTARQGGLMIGHVPVAQGLSALSLDGAAVPVHPHSGHFLLGFGRDAPATSVLTITHHDGSEETVVIAVAPYDWPVQRLDGLPDRKVSPPHEDLAKIRSDGAAIAEARRRRTMSFDAFAGLVMPLEGRISGVFGAQRILNGKPRSPHSGLDLAAPTGTPIAAPLPGDVSLVVPDMFFTGKTVMLDHGLGLASVYAHMNSIAVTEGQRVMQGEVLGTVGATGRATGPHLHWGVSWQNVKLDPQAVVDVLTTLPWASAGAPKATAPGPL